MKKISRRKLLRTGANVLGSTAALSALPLTSTFSESMKALTAKEGMLPRRANIPYMPFFSMAERDWRWARVRALMDESGIDLLVVPSTPYERGLPALGYASYLGDVPFFTPGAVVFPREGDPAIFGVMPMPPGPELWIKDQAPESYPLAKGIIEKINAHGAGKKRIGVIGTKAGVTGLNEFADHGVMLYPIWAHIQESFPEAEFVDITSEFAQLVLVKSAEELSALEVAAAKGEEFHKHLLNNFKPGMSELDARVAISEWFIRNRAGTAVEVFEFVSPKPVIADGTVINTEYDVFFGGGRVQTTLSMAFGPLSKQIQSLRDVAEAALKLGVEKARPGNTFGETTSAMEELIFDAGYWSGFPNVHSLAPLALVGKTRTAPPPSPQDDIWGAEVVLKPGMILSFECNARIGPRAQVKVGGTGYVADDGFKMLNTIGNKLHSL